MLFFRLMLFSVILAPSLGFAEEDQNVSYRGTYGTERWREKYQYKGRNSGGWRHGNWYGGVDENHHERENEAYIWYYDFNAIPPERPENVPIEEPEYEEEYLEDSPEGHGVYIEQRL